MTSSRVVAAVVDVRDAEALAAFWAESVGASSIRRWSDDRDTRFVEVAGKPTLLFQQSLDPAGGAALHLDVAPPAGDGQAEEVAQPVVVGARLLVDNRDRPWVVSADRKGNRFCLPPPRGS